MPVKEDFPVGTLVHTEFNTVIGIVVDTSKHHLMANPSNSICSVPVKWTRGDSDNPHGNFSYCNPKFLQLAYRSSLSEYDKSVLYEGMMVDGKFYTADDVRELLK